MKRRISSFSVILIMAVMSFVGIITLPMLNIQYKPIVTNRTISVSFTYPNASPEIVETDVTSKIEGLMAGLSGNIETSSTSSRGGGVVSAKFDKRIDLAQARLELASAIRNIYSDLPDGVSYPEISHNVYGNVSSGSMSYLIKSSLPSLQIDKYAREYILPQISTIEGVENVSVLGATPFHMVVTFDPAKASSLGISASDIVSALSNAFSDHIVGLSSVGNEVVAVRLSTAIKDFADIPVKNANGKVVYLSQIADWKYEESLPLKYHRVNGLNTLTMNVGIASDANLLNVTAQVRQMMDAISLTFPPEITSNLAYDSSEFVRSELERIFFRTGLCILILLLFVLIVNRSWRYMLIITISLIVNLLTSLAIYAFAGVSIHIYTMAGITVSLGIVIDTSIIMIDHYAHYRNLKVFPSLIAAVATTVAALLMVLLLPESEKANLLDFILVISLNLSLSLFVSWLFIPALMDYIPLYPGGKTVSFQRKRFQVSLASAYSKYIIRGTKHKWLYIFLFVLAFGLPICLLPSASDLEGVKDKSLLNKTLYSVVSWRPYQDNRAAIDKMAGSSFGAFYRALDRSDFYREPQQTRLYIRAGMLEGTTVYQLNEVVKAMENYLAGFDQIKVFVTDVVSHSDARITVEFKPEYEYSSFPQQLKSLVTSMAINFGGANWQVYGVDNDSFNNNIVSGYKSHRITLRGYNYADLQRFAKVLVDRLSKNRRISEPEIWGAGWDGRPKTEFVMSYDLEKMAVAGVDPNRYYSSLSSYLFDGVVTSAVVDGEMTEVILRSSGVDEYDYWHLLHAPLLSDVSLQSFGNIEKRRSELNISKLQQSYELNVCFDFLGSYELASRFIKKQVDYMNNEVLPVGFKASNPSAGWWDENRDRYAWLIFLIMAVIFVMLAITFESVSQPFAVIFMIPISFIGLFLTFGLSHLSFDQGGFAAFVSLCGIVVNAGIYIVMTYNGLKRRYPRSSCVDCYVKAFGMKIHPIIMTVVSTILGLVPFLSGGPQEVFWFDYAIGIMGGMLFSIIALLLYLPVFTVHTVNDRK